MRTLSANNWQALGQSHGAAWQFGLSRSDLAAASQLRFQGSPSTGRQNGDGSWPSSTNTVLATNATWTTPASQIVDARGAAGAYAVVTLESISGGTIDLDLEACPILSMDEAAWTTVVSSTGITTAGVQVLKVTRLSTQVVTGYLRLRITCTAGPSTLNFRGELLQKQVEDFESGVWLEALPVGLTGSGTWDMPLTWLVDCSRFLSCYLLLSYSGSDGSAVTARLQTAVALSADANLWNSVATTTLAATSQLLDGRSTLSTPPMGLLRLRLEHSGGGTASGVLRVHYLLKEI